MSPLLKGLIVGFSIAAPVGPIGLLCIRRSLASGRLAGFVSGLGAATADAIYGVVAALGLTAITAFLLEQRHWLQLAGGVFLVYFGVATLRARPPVKSADAPVSNRLAAAFVSTLVLTLTNPMTILSFIGIFAGVGLTGADGAWPASLLVAGVFLGSATWWLILSTLAHGFGRHFSTGGLRALNFIAGLILLSFGIWQLARLRWQPA